MTHPGLKLIPGVWKGRTLGPSAGWEPALSRRSRSRLPAGSRRRPGSGAARGALVRACRPPSRFLSGLFQSFPVGGPPPHPQVSYPHIPAILSLSA